MSASGTSGLSQPLARHSQQGYPSSPTPSQGQQAPTQAQEVVLVPNTWEYHMLHGALPQAKATHHELASSRQFDCVRQMCGAIFCGIFCLPCAGVRLVRSCKGLDPMKVEICGTSYPVPGLEYCSAADCSQICGKDDRGYDHKEYRQPQNNGSGLARSTLDKLNFVGVTILGVLIGAKAATS